MALVHIPESMLHSSPDPKITNTYRNIEENVSAFSTSDAPCIHFIRSIKTSAEAKACFHVNYTSGPHIFTERTTKFKPSAEITK